MLSITHTDVEDIATIIGIDRVDLQHDCDERAKECKCYENESQHHLIGNADCPQVDAHSACQHDIATLILALDSLIDG